MRSIRPLIAVTGPNKRFAVCWWATRLVLWFAGARSCYITPANPQLDVAIDGVVIGGGDDINPQHYGEQATAGSRYNSARDRLEMSMIKSALDAGIPIMGICRGAQLINVVLGGNLSQDIRPMRVLTSNRSSIFCNKWASMKTDSLLHKIVGSHTIKINSLHRQAVSCIAESLAVVATDDDNFVQAFESKKDDFLLGVQWHPEYLFYKSSQRKLFTALVRAVNRQQKQLTSFFLEQ
jgi:putative glutamine amidotransferase